MPTLTVTGMSCDGCEAAVTEALDAIDGVKNPDADHETDTVTFDGEADVNAVVAAIEDAGYAVEA